MKNKYSDLLTIEDRVTQILEENPQARKSDYILASKLIEQLAYEGGQTGKIKPTDRAKMYEIAQAIFLYSSLPIPPFTSIGRARRKAQERRPALKDETIGDLRKQQEDVFVNYSHT
jgi:hypothetical protein